MTFLRSTLVCISMSFLTIGCQPQEEDPISEFNRLVKDYGYIGFQNALEESMTGTLIAGRPTAVSFVANHRDCFPEEELQRHYDRSDFNKVYNYTYQGNLGFLADGNSIISAGLGLTNQHSVHIEMSGMTMEYLSSIDVTDWYREGMSETCRDYLDQVGFMIQALSAEKLTLSIKKTGGLNVGLDTGNISQFFQFEAGVDWQITDEYHVEITTPKYIGYQLGRLRKEDDGMVLYRAMSESNDKYVFEAIGLFEDDQAKSLSKVRSEMDNHIYKRK